MSTPPLSPPPALLPLDDDRWGTLRHAYGPATDTPEALRAIERDPVERYSASLAGMRASPTPWEHIVVAVVHQETPYSATYAALPHVVRVAQEHVGLRGAALAVLGSALVGSAADPCPPELELGWDWALTVARAWAPRPEARGYDMAFELRGFLALRHVTELVHRIDQISTGEVEGLCPHCGEYALITLPDVELPLCRYASPPADWPREETPLVARDVARWAGDTELAEHIAGLDVPMPCRACGATFTPLEAVEAEGRASGRG